MSNVDVVDLNLLIRMFEFEILLTTANIAHRQWMSSDSLNLSRFSGTSPKRSGSKPKSLKQRKKNLISDPFSKSLSFVIYVHKQWLYV